jgi:hypothetical protein
MNRIALKNLIAILLITLSLLHFSSDLYGQAIGGTLTGASINSIPVSVPFLTIAPDGRSSGMGDAGAASSPDVYSQHWNAAKYAFSEGKGGTALTYTPWLTNLIPEVRHLYLAGFYKISDKNIISSSFRYFFLGTINFVSAGGPLKDFHPRELALDAGYTRMFTDHFSGSLVLRYIYSDLITGASAAPLEARTGNSLAVDLGLYYQNDFRVRGKAGQWALGLNISNIGQPVSYTENDEGLPIPTNLRLGGRLTFNINENNSFSLLADLNKLLVPSPAVYEQDSISGNLLLLRGREPGSIVHGMLQSFYDAPGILLTNGRYSTAKEEFNEIALGLGAEYRYKKRIALRTGYFHEHDSKGNRKYFTFGLGARYSFLTCDISYLLPPAGAASPLYNTFRFSLAIEIG